MKEIPMPAIIRDFFEGFPRVDIHDRNRQGILRLEYSWPTKTWWHRLFATIFAIIVTNSYMAYKYDYIEANFGEYSNCLSYEEFMDVLAYELIHYKASGGRKRRNSASIIMGADGEEVIDAYMNHNS
jgi:hypothetical protein